MAIKSIVFAVIFFCLGGFILLFAFHFSPIMWDVVIIGGIVMLVSPLLLWLGISSLLRHTPSKTEAGTDVLNTMNDLFK